MAIRIFALCFLFLLQAGFQSNAQILNLEKTHYKRDSTTFLFINGAFSSRLYNRTAADDDPINFFALGAQLEAAYFSEHHLYTFLSSLDYFNINKSPFNSTGYAHLRGNFMQQRTLSYELFTQIQYDKLRLLDYRFLSGGGLRLRLLDTEGTHIFLNVGAMYETERWNDPTADTEREVTKHFLKSANYLSMRTQIKEHVNLNAIAYYQVGYDRSASIFRHRYSLETNGLFRISDLVTFKVSFIAAYENAPIVPITKFIYALSNGIQLKLNRKRKSLKAQKRKTTN